jgi:dihydroneopterin aldolase
MLKVVVKGLEFYGFHGVSKAEREVGHRLVAHIEASLPSDACESDDIRDTVDYSELADLMIEVSESKSFKTLEALAHSFCRHAIKEWPVIQQIRVRLTKRMPPADVIAEETGVELILRND